jgi:hypothetical protein
MPIDEDDEDEDLQKTTDSEKLNSSSPDLPN